MKNIKKYTILLLFYWCVYANSFGQIDTSKFYQLTPFERALISDFWTNLDTCTSDSSKVVLIRSMYMQMNDNDVWIQFTDLMYKYLKSYYQNFGVSKFYKNHLLHYYNDKAYYEAYKNNDKEAIKYYIKAYYLAKESKRYDLLYTYLNNIGQYLHKIGQFEKAVTFINESFKILEKTEEYSHLGLLHNNLAYMYYEQGENEQAIQLYNKALSIGYKQKDTSLIALVYNNFALVFFETKDYKKSEEYINKSLALRKSIGEEVKYAQSLNNLASLYLFQKRYKEAIPIIHHVIEIKNKNSDFESLNYSYFTLSKIYFETNKFDSAFYYSRKALQIADMFGFPYMYKDASDILYKLFEKKQQLDSAYIYYKLHITMRDSIYNERNVNATIKQKLKNDFEKKEAILEAQKKSEIAIAQSEKQKQKVINYFVAFMLLAVSIIAFIIYRSLKISQKQKKIIQLQKEESDKQRKIVEEKQKEILDSIHYAKRIQQALITSETYIHKHLNRLKEKN